MAGNLFQRISQTPAVQILRQRVESGGVLPLWGISAAGRPFLAALLRHLFPARPLVVVTEGVKSQESYHQDIATWLREIPGSPLPLFYPAWETLPHEAKLPHADVISERLETLVSLSAESPASTAPLIVTNVVALQQRTFPKGEIEKRTRTLNKGDQMDPLDLVEWLEEQGYEPEAKVTQKGEISLRGGILDVYPLISPWPVRLEFFGNELESLRHFDPLTQISRDAIERVTLSPGGELALLKRAVDSKDPQLKESALASLLDHLPDSTLWLLSEPEALAEHADSYAQQVPENDPFFTGWSEILAKFEERQMLTLLVNEGESASSFTESVDGSPQDESSDSTRTADESVDAAKNQTPAFTLASLDAFRPLGERSPDPQIAEAQRREFFQQLHRWLRQNYAVHVFCNNDGERQRFDEIWGEYGLGALAETAGGISGKARGSDTGIGIIEGDAGSGEGSTAQRGPADSIAKKRIASTASKLNPIVSIGALTRGFLCEGAKLVVVTDAEVFGRYKVQRPRRLKSPHAVAARSALDIDFTELQEGDFVVHLQHGIGRYRGLELLPRGEGQKGSVSRPIEGHAQEQVNEECLVIEYASSEPNQPPPRLYVPVTEAHLVSKYVGAGKARPTLNTLGGTRWIKAKAQAERAVRDLAGELLSIQAARESQSGHSFGLDTPWQREFEGAFLYEETPDQMRAINETKKDLEAAKPMDRLICGDVGYGKTEVAIRAAFKAVMGGKQVAILVPTTILAEQHYHTFRERMADYPIRIEQLSRFCGRRDQKRVIEQLAEGSVDIVIGTHRLIQSDVAFKDLGLVVIDEEQRFGVMHKEKFKLLRKLVDVLTLSATPIPRTLYLALTGARDMSTIETPPQDRLPVETVVTQYDERLIRDAIQRELNRQGQVYYLHNRVLDIDSVALRIKALVPNARVVIGHGQMDSDDLEEVMSDFINGEADVLVSTTIIESGIDIPNANTIIIERADRYGLSDLYQLRGRVGRYKHQAYAYLLLPRHAALLSDVRKRITAIKQYSSLGSGFKIAMRDLEIRGAGNLLGPQQSGHITAVGFELYCQLLKQSVSALKGEKVRPRVDVAVRIDFLRFHPGEEANAKTQETFAEKSPTPASEPEVVVPREVATRVERRSRAEESEGERKSNFGPPAAAYIPFKYIQEAHQRIEIYRKLAQATDKASLEQLRAELRDRFGKIPPGAELLMDVAELKFLAAERGVTAIETRGDRLMLQRNTDFITIDGKFPRLTKKDAKGRLKEIKKLLLVL